MTPKHEIEAMLERVDLCALIGQDVALMRETPQSLHGPCPWCAGRDRFTVRPEEGRWFCRRCSRYGDAIDYLIERDGITFREALQALGAAPTYESPRPAPKPRKEAPAACPSSAWQSVALVAVERAEAALWSPAGERARAWLADRGLREDTLRACRVGFTRGGIVDGLRLSGPAIVLPWFIGPHVWALKLRLLEAAPGGPRYLSVTWADRARAAAEPAGAPIIYRTPRPAHVGRPIVLVEGEFDAMLLWQEAGDLADVASLGSASKGLDDRARLALHGRPVLVAYDGDEAGERGATALLERLPRARRATSPAAPPGKDLTDAHRQGVDLRAWLSAALAAAYPEHVLPEPSHGMAVIEAPSSPPAPPVLEELPQTPQVIRTPGLLPYTPGVALPPVTSSTYHTYPESGGAGSNRPGTSWLSQAPGGFVCVD